MLFIWESFMGEDSPITRIRENLLQSRLDGLLKGPKDVLEIVRLHQPAAGLSNQEWIDVTNFIMEIEEADNIPAAKIVAEKYNLQLEV